MNCLKAQYKYELMGLYFGEIFVFTLDVTGGWRRDSFSGGSSEEEFIFDYYTAVIVTADYVTSYFFRELFCYLHDANYFCQIKFFWLILLVLACISYRIFNFSAVLAHLSYFLVS